MKLAKQLAFWLMLASPALAEPVITNVYVSASTPTTATIVWTTDEASSSQILWGYNLALPYSNTVDTTMVTSHSMTLTLLSAGPMYYFATVSKDSLGRIAQSTTYQFSLCGSPTTPVAGTVNQFYQLGPYTLTWVPPAGSSGTPTVCGQPFSTTVTGNLNGSGSFSNQVADAYKVTPGPGTWNVQVQDLGDLAPITIQAPLSSVTQDISMQLQLAASASGLTGCIANTITNHAWPPACAGGGGGSGPAVQTNGTLNSNQTLLNFVNPSTFNGLTLAFSNPSGGIETLLLSGTLNNSGLTNPSLTWNGTTCTLGASCTPPVVSTVNSNPGPLVLSFSSGAGNCTFSGGTTTCSITGSSSGGGSVTNFIASAGAWPTWLVPSVSSSTTTPTLSVSASAIPFSGLSSLAANQVLGALTATTPSGLTMPSCSAGSSALTWASGSGFGCNTINGIPYPSGTGIPSVSSGSSWVTTYNASNLIPASFVSTLNQNSTGNSATATALQAAPSLCSVGNAPIGVLASGNATGCAPLGGSPLWSSLLSPTSNNSLSMAALTTTFTYGAATGSADMFKLQDSASNTGTGILFHVTTAAGSTEIPFQADANGVGCNITASGVTCFGGTHILTLGANSGGLPSPVASSGSFSTDASGNLFSSIAGGTFYRSTQTIASGTSALGTGAILSGVCATVVTTAATGTATTDTLGWGFNGDPTSTVGYQPTTAGMLTIIAYPSSGNANFKVCNNTGSSVTPGAITLNWRVTR